MTRVRVNVGGGPSVLEVAVALGGDVPGDADRCASVGDTGRELGHGRRLVLARQTLVVVLAVDGNVLEVALLELLDRVLDRGHALARRPHLLGRVVGVAAGTVPVALEGLGVERGLSKSQRKSPSLCFAFTHGDTPLLTYAEKEESGHPEVVTELDAGARADLELPLRGHDLGVDTRDLDAGVQACSLQSVSRRHEVSV